MPSQDVPDGRQEEPSASGYEAEEEDDHGEVLLVHEMVAQTRATTRDAAIGKLNVELAEAGRDAFNEETVKGAYGCVAAYVSRAAKSSNVSRTERPASVRRKLQTSPATPSR